MGMNDVNSLSHTRWNCKYHIVFAPKYRRKVFYNEKRAAVGKILRQLCEWKGVKLSRQKHAQTTSIFMWRYHRRFPYHTSWGI